MMLTSGIMMIHHLPLMVLTTGFWQHDAHFKNCDHSSLTVDGFKYRLEWLLSARCLLKNHDHCHLPLMLRTTG
jgi:hypothetical protein